jgi:DNA-binding transcriptional ArsR family regulator
LTKDDRHEENSQDHRLQASAFLAKSLADENRLRILFFLRDGRQSVSRIVEALGLSQPLVSHHLRELRRALLVEVERKGPFVFYGLSTPDILTIMGDLQVVAENLLSQRQMF